MCKNCYEQYNIKRRSKLFCKKCGCELVEIDENFIEAIILLNKKGYYTCFCCSGHPNNKDCYHAYISFEDGLILPNLPSKYMYDKDRWPDINFLKHNCDGYAIRIEFEEKENLIKLQKEILISAINVLEWAEKLPHRKETQNK
jgi:hypothetical protein